jgi:hypothetical protein
VTSTWLHRRRTHSAHGGCIQMASDDSSGETRSRLLRHCPTVPERPQGPPRSVNTHRRPSHLVTAGGGPRPSEACGVCTDTRPPAQPQEPQGSRLTTALTVFFRAGTTHDVPTPGASPPMQLVHRGRPPALDMTVAVPRRTGTVPLTPPSAGARGSARPISDFRPLSRPPVVTTVLAVVIPVIAVRGDGSAQPTNGEGS